MPEVMGAQMGVRGHPVAVRARPECSEKRAWSGETRRHPAVGPVPRPDSHPLM